MLLMITLIVTSVTILATSYYLINKHNNRKKKIEIFLNNTGDLHPVKSNIIYELTTLKKKITTKNLAKIYGNKKINVTKMKYNILNFNHQIEDEFMTMKDFLKKIKEGEQLYYAQNEIIPEIKDMLWIPSCIGEEENNQKGINYLSDYFNSEKSSSINISNESIINNKLEKMKIENIVFWIGGGNQYTPLHFDHDDGWLCVIKGYKKIRLIHPKYTKYLKPFIGLMYSEYTNIDYIPNKEKDLIQIIELTIKEGQSLFIPAGWWHDVYSSSGFNIAYTIWTYPCRFGKKYDYAYTVKRLEIIQDRNIPKKIDRNDISKKELYRHYDKEYFPSLSGLVLIANPMYTNKFD